jgi:hypothetical protein
MRAMIHRQDHPSKRRWEGGEIRLLGRVPDTEIGRKLEIAVSTVAAERQRHGIPPYRGSYVWVDKALRLLGTDSDARIAAILGVSTSVVSTKRRQIGIRAYFAGYGSSSSHPDPLWTPKRDALLGKASDAVIARRLGVTHSRVRGRRCRLGIPPACPIPRYDWTGIDPLLGREADAPLAARLGVNEDTVRRRRLKLKIPPYQPERRTIRRDRALLRLLAQPTAEIAEVSSSAVALLRQELEVPPPPRRTCWSSCDAWAKSATTSLRGSWESRCPRCARSATRWGFGCARGVRGRRLSAICSPGCRMIGKRPASWGGPSRRSAISASGCGSGALRVGPEAAGRERARAGSGAGAPAIESPRRAPGRPPPP